MRTIHSIRLLLTCLPALACASAGARATTDTLAPSSAARNQQGRDTRLLAEPALSEHHIAFSYAGDLWVVDRSGGDARRLTSDAGTESHARFSPDGNLIAFSGQYDGNTDVFVVPVTGGVPKRLTWHPGPDVVQDFTADGKAVLFGSRRDVHTRRFQHVFTVPVDGGPPTRLPIPSAYNASYSPDGTKIAYTPLYEAFNQWKHYRGGTASRVWIYDVADHSVEQVPQPEDRCNDTDPVWVGDTLYFRSDRAGEFNLFSFTSGATSPTQLTQHADFPIVNSSAGGGAVVYEQAGYLHIYEPGGGSSTRVAIGAAADLLETRPRFVSGANYLRSASLSPSGARAVLGFRGEIVTVPAEKGDPRNITNTTAVHERYPVWSPDGQSIAYFSDASGEYELHIAAQDGRGEARTFVLGGAGFYDDPHWSPDGAKISYSDNSWSLYVLDVESGDVTHVASEPIYGPQKTLSHAWSPDSAWIAYTLTNVNNFRRAFLYQVATQISTAITEGLGDVGEPVFDASGKYLYLTASTDAGPARTWFAQSNADVVVSNALYLVVLPAGELSPLAKQSDEEEPAEDTPDDEDGESKEDEEDTEENTEVAIAFEGMSQRIVSLGLSSASYSSLEPGDEGQLFYLKRQPGEGGAGSLTRFDLKTRKEQVLMEEVGSFLLSGDKQKILTLSGGTWRISKIADKLDASKGRLGIDSIQVQIDPLAEWAQILDEAWRVNRDYFYDPGMHGADWPAMKTKYAAFLPHLSTRADLNRVMTWMCSEVGVGHHRNGGGDSRLSPDSVPGGLLGADYTIENGRYRFARVFGGLNWNPSLRSPLTEPGVDVKAGEYLLAVDGRDLTASENLYGRFERTAGRIVELTVGPSPGGEGSRTVEVVPIGNESSLRNRAWVEGNIERVTEATAGKVAYVYVPNTAGLGHEYFKRYFFPQADRQAIIIDERHNGGGQIADYYIDLLRRPYMSSWATRYGADLRTPSGAIEGPKVMLIDETAGSGGDMLPWMFKKLALGPLVGRPTWGGLVGVLGFPTLMDGGRITAPNLAIWTEEGFIVENVGVPPDIEVEMFPADVQDGRDPQLEKAIEVALELLEANPPVVRTRPPFPIRGNNR